MDVHGNLDGCDICIYVVFPKTRLNFTASEQVLNIEERKKRTKKKNT